MRASLTRRPVRIAAIGGTVAVALALAAGARGEDRGDAQRLRTANADLAVETQEALLELYALESRLARAERRLAALEIRAHELEEREAAARKQLTLARRARAEAERQLASRLQTLYIEGEVDPLAVLLGAESLDEALSALDGLDRLATQDRAIMAQVDRTRRTLRKSVRRLAARRADAVALVAEAAAARSSLAQARTERVSYLAGLREQQVLNERRITSLLARASAAERRAAQVVPASAPASAPAPAPAPAPVPVPQSGSQMTVASTGYCLDGTTATGVPVGWGVVAVDPAVIPLGTRMYVPGYGDGVAADTGSAVRGAMIDLWFPSCAQALAWGRRVVTITLEY